MKDKLSKPEKKVSLNGGRVESVFNSGYNQGLEDMQAYHDQEMQRVVDEREEYIKFLESKYNVTDPDEKYYELEDKVKQLERALAIESQEPEERSQEANHYNWLDDKNEELEVKVKQLEQQLKEVKGEHKKDLKDLEFIIEQVANVYCHITNGKLSKPMYFSSVVISEAEECISKRIEEETTELEQQIKDLVSITEEQNDTIILVNDKNKNLKQQIKDKDWIINALADELQQIKESREVSVDKIARLMTQISEEKYYGKAFTFNYMVDEIATAIHNLIYGD